MIGQRERLDSEPLRQHAEQLQRAFDEVTARLASSESKLQGVTEECVDLEAKVEIARRVAAVAKRTTQRTKQELDDKQVSIQALHRELESVRAQLEVHRVEIAGHTHIQEQLEGELGTSRALLRRTEVQLQEARDAFVKACMLNARLRDALVHARGLQRLWVSFAGSTLTNVVGRAEALALKRTLRTSSTSAWAETYRAPAALALALYDAGLGWLEHDRDPPSLTVDRQLVAELDEDEDERTSRWVAAFVQWLTRHEVELSRAKPPPIAKAS